MKRHRKQLSDGFDGGDEFSGNDEDDPASPSEQSEQSEQSEESDSLTRPPKKRRLKGELEFLLKIPNGDWYCRSYMHRSYVAVVVCYNEYVASGSVDGIVKLWKRAGDSSLEELTQFRAHDNIPVKRLCFSLDGHLVASISDDPTVKIFDVTTADMVAIVEIPFEPLCISCAGDDTFVVSDAHSSDMYIVSPRDFSKKKCTTAHKFPISQLAYNAHHNCVVSADINGIIEYWQPDTFAAPTDKDIFQYKSDTDLYCLRKANTRPLSLSVSNDGSKLAMFAADYRVRVFDFCSGKIIAEFDESTTTTCRTHELGKSVYQPEDFDKRVIVEKQVETVKGAMRKRNVIFDKSGNFVLYATVLGIKVVNIQTHKCRVLLGKDEQVRFLNLAMPCDTTKSPLLLATGFRKSRLYLFKYSHEPINRAGRDVQNEKAEESSASSGKTETEQVVDKEVGQEVRKEVADDGNDNDQVEQEPKETKNIVTLHTSAGDIDLELYADVAPKAVENFTKHCKQEYYDGTAFHRIVKGFMIQTGKPTDGGEGMSIWGDHFEDEFSSDYKHDEPFVVSMANAGPGTNASQFYITTAPAPWLDGKHTIFGRVVRGQDVVSRIEQTETDRNDAPLDAPVILSTKVR